MSKRVHPIGQVATSSSFVSPHPPLGPSNRLNRPSRQLTRQPSPYFVDVTHRTQIQNDFRPLAPAILLGGDENAPPDIHGWPYSTVAYSPVAPIQPARRDSLQYSRPREPASKSDFVDVMYRTEVQDQYRSTALAILPEGDENAPPDIHGWPYSMTAYSTVPPFQPARRDAPLYPRPQELVSQSDFVDVMHRTEIEHPWSPLAAAILPRGDENASLDIHGWPYSTTAYSPVPPVEPARRDAPPYSQSREPVSETVLGKRKASEDDTLSSTWEEVFMAEKRWLDAVVTPKRFSANEHQSLPGSSGNLDHLSMWDESNSSPLPPVLNSITDSLLEIETVIAFLSEPPAAPSAMTEDQFLERTSTRAEFVDLSSAAYNPLDIDSRTPAESSLAGMLHNQSRAASAPMQASESSDLAGDIVALMSSFDDPPLASDTLSVGQEAYDEFTCLSLLAETSANISSLGTSCEQPLFTEALSFFTWPDDIFAAAAEEPTNTSSELQAPPGCDLGNGLAFPLFWSSDGLSPFAAQHEHLRSCNSMGHDVLSLSSTPMALVAPRPTQSMPQSAGHSLSEETSGAATALSPIAGDVWPDNNALASPANDGNNRSYKCVFPSCPAILALANIDAHIASHYPGVKTKEMVKCGSPGCGSAMQLRSMWKHVRLSHYDAHRTDCPHCGRPQRSSGWDMKRHLKKCKGLS
ncbi:hypothetical protein NEOLEDRAFT_1181289 [Neolentinus lepideus HHB14362 ss-1]|uniref:Uncharacterized protein n=1 Tax=Neolentinus lepideus HHB14362 ss-1 TaxID=1314782 RepID=A0A165Q4G1_9AGAM|nr:hypothetical protein NEOLEDRAFT_1181289 [Neolentinus lepideus HHB14362 ss-1]